MFSRLATPELPLAVLRALREGKSPSRMVASVPDFPKRFYRIRLLARSESPLLLALLRNSIQSAWLEAVGLDESELATDDRADLEFVFGGAIALLGSDVSDDFEALLSFPDRDLGRAALATMKWLGRRATESHPG